MERLIELLIKQFKLTEEDSIIAVLFAVVGFSIDVLYFPAGIPATLVAFLSGITALMVSRLVKNRRFFIERALKNVEQLVEQGRILQHKASITNKELSRSG